MSQPSSSEAALEMRRCIEEIKSAHHWTTHLVVEELAARAVDAQSVQELVNLLETIDCDHYNEMEGIDLVPDFAIKALAAVGNELVVDVLVQTLTATHPGKVVGAAAALGEIGTPRAVEPLIKVLQHRHYVVRTLVAQALGQIGDPAAQEALIALLNDPHWLPRQAAAGALSKLADERGLEPLVTAFYRLDLEREGLFPVILVEVMGRIHNSLSESVLLDILKNTPSHEYDVRNEAMSSLAKLGSQAAVEPLIQALSEEPDSAKMRAAEALGVLGDTRAVDPLLVLLEHSNPLVRGKTARALGLLKDSRALPTLRKTSQTDHEYYVTRIRVSDLAREAIERIEAASSDRA